MSTDDPYTNPTAAPQPLGAPTEVPGASFAFPSQAQTPFVPAPAPILPANGFAAGAIALTGVYTLLTLVSALLVRSSIERTKEALAHPDTASPFGNVTNSALSGLNSLVGIAAFVFLALWMMRIRKNLAAVGAPAGGPPNVEWWGWFVPIANFVLPLLGMRAISRRGVGWGALLGWWIPYCVTWALWPATFSAAIRAVDFSTGTLTHPEILDSTVPLTYTTTAALVVSWLFLLLIIRRTTARHLGTTAVTA